MRRSGFTLIEIIIVCAILATLAALGIPGMLRARHNANESAAIDSVRSFSTAMESFRAAQIPPAYPAALNELSTANPQYLGASFTSATTPATSRQGYYFTYNRPSANSFGLQAIPQTVGMSGTRRFYVDETGVIRADPSGPAGPADPEIQ